eukprot:1161104-Pelagomonas_calceolata.AAC.3
MLCYPGTDQFLVTRVEKDALCRWEALFLMHAAERQSMLPSQMHAGLTTHLADAVLYSAHKLKKHCGTFEGRRYLHTLPFLIYEEHSYTHKTAPPTKFKPAACALNETKYCEDTRPGQQLKGHSSSNEDSARRLVFGCLAFFLAHCCLSLNLCKNRSVICAVPGFVYIQARSLAGCKMGYLQCGGIQNILEALSGCPQRGRCRQERKDNYVGRENYPALTKEKETRRLNRSASLLPHKAAEQKGLVAILRITGGTLLQNLAV